MMAEVNRPYHQIPHRKPVAAGGGGGGGIGSIPPLTSGLGPDPHRVPSHSHTRTVSSSIFPTAAAGTAPHPSAAPSATSTIISTSTTQSPISYGSSNPSILQVSNQTRRSVSNATASSNKSGTIYYNMQSAGADGGGKVGGGFSSGPIPIRNASSASDNASAASLRRNFSARSGQSSNGSMTGPPLGYVALMRRQKATVWCDRSQHQDPVTAAQARAAKLRAAQDVAIAAARGSVDVVVGGSSSMGGSGFLGASGSFGLSQSGARSSTSGSMGSGNLGGVRGKITHRHLHTGGKSSGGTMLSSANLLGTTGVPTRLSASEVDNEDDAEYGHGYGYGSGNHDEAGGGGSSYHHRAGSGRSSLTSGQRWTTLNHRAQARRSQGSTPPSGQGSSPAGEQQQQQQQARQSSDDYFQQNRGGGSTQSSGSGTVSPSSGGDEAQFGEVGSMLAPSRIKDISPGGSGSGAEDLIRRGSVDERANTMRGAVKLFIANPDFD